MQILNSAHIKCNLSILIKDMPQDESITIGCFSYYIDNGNERILIDTGIDSITVVNKTKSSVDNWTRSTEEFPISENLNNLKIDTKTIDKVFLTHSHYDHISGVVHFQNATIIMAEEEYAFMKSDENPHKEFQTEIIAFLEEKKINGQLVLADDSYIDGGFECKVVGGHTPGSMLIYYDKYLFTGDAVFLRKNIENNKPIGFSKDPEKSKYVLCLCRKHDGDIYTGHDFRCICQ